MAKNIKRSEIGQILVDLREQYHIDSQQTIADMLGIKRDTYARYETDTNPPISIIKKLCSIYKISSDVIIGNDGDYRDTLHDKQPGMRLGTYIGYSPNAPLDSIVLTDDEITLIERYRRLSQTRQESLLTLLDE